MPPSYMSWITNRMHVFTSTIIWPFGRMGRVTFFSGHWLSWMFAEQLEVEQVFPKVVALWLNLILCGRCSWFRKKAVVPPGVNFPTKLLCEYCGRKNVWLKWKSVISSHGCAIDPLNNGNKQFSFWVFDVFGISFLVYQSGESFTNVAVRTFVLLKWILHCKYLVVLNHNPAIL